MALQAEVQGTPYEDPAPKEAWDMDMGAVPSSVAIPSDLGTAVHHSLDSINTDVG